MDEIELRILNGDGATWIRNGHDNEGDHFQLDKFHSAASRKKSEHRSQEKCPLCMPLIICLLPVIEIEALKHQNNVNLSIELNSNDILQVKLEQYLNIGFYQL
jgi:hypothetical protein